jgi:hypothetical protein
MRLYHLALAVRDRQWSLAFSARYFRFDPASARTYPDGAVIVRTPDGFALALGVDETAPRRCGVPALRVRRGFPEEAEDLRARMIAEGVVVVEEEDTEAYVLFKCLDPDGRGRGVLGTVIQAAQGPPRWPIADA